jgi:hypothetical protein
VTHVLESGQDLIGAVLDTTVDEDPAIVGLKEKHINDAKGQFELARNDCLAATGCSLLRSLGIKQAACSAGEKPIVVVATWIVK